MGGDSRWIALAEVGFAHRSQSAEGHGNPHRVPIKIGAKWPIPG
jgi:hypothetical protein